jgi:hypothetical protein
MRNGFQSTWLNFVKNVLDNSGLNNIWLSQGNFNSKWLNENLKRNLKDQFIQKWRSDMENSSKGYHTYFYRYRQCSSPYIIKFGVDFLRFNNNLQNFNCTLSNNSILLKPKRSIYSKMEI